MFYTEKTFILDTNDSPFFGYRQGYLFFNRLLINDDVFILTEAVYKIFSIETSFIEKTFYICTVLNY